MSTLQLTLCELAEPNPASLIESLRAFGYSLATAVADLIDNSLTAGATKVQVELTWNGADSTVCVLDNGRGMTREELVSALRPGSLNPLEVRDPKDLGRFGLGLKTASFSQCRRLTVHTKTSEGEESRRTWDLDHVGKSGEWRLIEQEDELQRQLAQPLHELASGTAVIWQACDRIVPPKTSVDDERAQRHFLELAEGLVDHIALVFHRFIEGVPPISISVNENRVKPFDPFLQKEAATRQLAEEPLKFKDESIVVRPFVLPHHSKMDRTAYDRAAGRRGWTQSQGFYVYRNRRLLVDGDWLSLGLRKEDHFKLARIQIDIPNTMDADWQIDVRKARATPPAALRERLLQIAQLTRTEASNVYRHRGARLRNADAELVLLWDRRISHGKPRYELNRDHPAIKRVLKGGICTADSVEALLQLIEETLPIPTITIDTAEFPDHQREPFEHQNTSDLVRLGVELAKAMRSSGSSPQEASARLSVLEPFHRLPHVVQSVEEELSHG